MIDQKKQQSKSIRNQFQIIWGAFQTLKDEFRINYANLWLSILDRDRKGMRQYSKNLGIEGDVYGLFACMVTGRTWDTIMKGIDRFKLTYSP